MLKLRPSDHEARVEIMPLIDVIFLLLTFFIYAMVLMIRAEVVPMDLPSLTAGEPAKPIPAVTISLDRWGELFVDRAPTTLDEAIASVTERARENPDILVYIAAEAQGDEDRLPIFLAIYDRLAHAGLDIRLIGKPDDTQN